MKLVMNLNGQRLTHFLTSSDLCFITDLDMDSLLLHLRKQVVPIEEGPVRRTGTLGPIESVYIRDPDLNLIEISRYIEEGDPS